MNKYSELISPLEMEMLLSREVGWNIYEMLVDLIVLQKTSYEELVDMFGPEESRHEADGGEFCFWKFFFRAKGMVINDPQILAVILNPHDRVQEFVLA